MAVQREASVAQAAFIIICGDVAYAGRSSEYYCAMTLLDHLKTELANTCSLCPAIVVVPGNHDCDFNGMSDKVRDGLIEQIREHGDAAVDENVIAHCSRVQNAFHEFCECYHCDASVRTSNPAFSCLEYDLGTSRIGFLCLNSALTSQKNEQLGHLFVVLPDGDSVPSGCDVVLAVLHHTLNWLSQANHRAVRAFLQGHVDFVLTGHEHEPYSERALDADSQSTVYIESPTTDLSASESSFNAVLLDPKSATYQLHTYSLRNDRYDPVYQSDGWIPYAGQKRMAVGRLPLRDDFLTRLQDPGAQFRHGSMALHLEDVFVWPDLRRLKPESEGKTLPQTVPSSDLQSIPDTAGRKVLLVGSEKSGKTALCKTLFRRYFDAGRVPVLLDGVLLRSVSVDRFHELVGQAALAQYHISDSQRFFEQDPLSKVVIIDDFDRAQLNSTLKLELLRKVSEVYRNVVVLGRDLIQFEDMLVTPDDGGASFADFEAFQILQFGHERRRELIRRWVQLGDDSLSEYDAILRREDEAKQVVDTVVGRNTIPAYPLFLLIILQAMEVGFHQNLQESAYGHYYQFLITQAIALVVGKTDKVEPYYAFLSEMARKVFDSPFRELALGEFEEFHRWYCGEYAVSSSFGELSDLTVLVRNLTSAGLVEQSASGFRFRYRYEYYFFMAKYLADRISTPEIKELVSAMCARLYYEEYANIVLFLTHHSKDPFILEEVVRNAKAIFPSKEPVRFEEDTKSISDLLQSVPKLVVQERDARETRRRHDRAADKASGLPQEEQAMDVEEDNSSRLAQPISALDVASELNLAVKMVGILGQVLRNYHSSLRGSLKQEIANEAYNLGLRASGLFFNALSENVEGVVGRIAEDLRDARISDDMRTEEEARKILFAICALVSYAFTKVTSESVGSKYLSETLEQVRTANDTVAVNLVDMAIKLDFFADFPARDLKRLVKRLGYEEPKAIRTRTPRPGHGEPSKAVNLLPLTVLRRLVADNIYMFPPDAKRRQWIGEVIGIEVAAQRAMVLDSTQRKK